MYLLGIPSDPGLIMAFGKLVIAHSQLELVLRYTVKTLSGVSVSIALDATEEERASDLRVRIKQLFKEKKPTATEKVQLDALLLRAKRLTEKRNHYLHSVLSVTPDGQTIMKGDDHAWGPAPTTEEVQAVTSDLLALYLELNEARLRGFLAQVATRHTHTSAGL